jgi:hypothetical protein
MVSGGARFIAKSGIDHDLMVSGIDVEAINRDPFFLAGLSFPEEVGSVVRNDPASVDRVYLYIVHFTSL